MNRGIKAKLSHLLLGTGLFLLLMPVRGQSLDIQPVWKKPISSLSLAFSPDGQLLASGNINWTVRLWRVTDGGLIRTLEGHKSAVNSVAFSPDSQLLASGSDDWTVRLWRVADGALIGTLRGHDGWVWSVAFSPDGQLLASAGSWDRTVRLWRVTDGALIRTLRGHTSIVSSVAFSPDGQLLASGSEDKTVRLWRVADGGLVRTLEGHKSAVNSVAFSPDSQLLASGSEDNTVRLWRVTDGAFIRTLEGHDDWVWSVAFSPDGQLLASGSEDNTVRLWRVTDGAFIRTLEGHTGAVYSVAFSPDGQRLASGGWEGLILWKIVGLPPVNLLSSTPLLLFPANGSKVLPTPTFKVKGVYLKEKLVKFEIQMTKGKERRTMETGWGAGDREAILTVSSFSPLSNGQWSWQVRAIDPQGAVSNWSEPQTFEVVSSLPLPTLANCLPTDGSMATTPEIIGGQKFWVARNASRTEFLFANDDGNGTLVVNRSLLQKLHTILLAREYRSKVEDDLSYVEESSKVYAELVGLQTLEIAFRSALSASISTGETLLSPPGSGKTGEAHAGGSTGSPPGSGKTGEAHAGGSTGSPPGGQLSVAYQKVVNSLPKKARADLNTSITALGFFPWFHSITILRALHTQPYPRFNTLEEEYQWSQWFLTYYASALDAADIGQLFLNFLREKLQKTGETPAKIITTILKDEALQAGLSLVSQSVKTLVQVYQIFQFLKDLFKTLSFVIQLRPFIDHGSFFSSLIQTRTQISLMAIAECQRAALVGR